MAVVKTLIGNVKGPQGEQGKQGVQGIQGIQGEQGPAGATGATGAQGPKGPQGATGATGQRGSRWNSGTKITGTSTTETIFSGTGITDALVNDMYLNTSTGYTYRCTVAGAASVAKWVYAGSIKGAKGAMGATGPQGEQGPQGIQGEKGEKGDTPTLITAYDDIMANTVSGYAPDALAVREGFTKVNNMLSTYSPKYISFTDEATLINYLDTLSEEIGNGFHYQRILNMAIALSEINQGGMFLLEGLRTHDNYEWQTLKKYASQGMVQFARSKYNGTWTPWLPIMGYLNIRNKITQGGLTLTDAYIENGMVNIHGYLPPSAAGGSFKLTINDSRYIPRYYTSCATNFSKNDDNDKLIGAWVNGNALYVWTNGQTTGNTYFHACYPVKSG